VQLRLETGRLTVEDTGIGIQPALRERVLDRPVRAALQTTWAGASTWKPVRQPAAGSSSVETARIDAGGLNQISRHISALHLLSHNLRKSAASAGQPRGGHPVPSSLSRTSLHLARQIVLWTMLLALPVYGCSATLLHILGPVHRHAATTTTTALEGERSHGAPHSGLARLVASWKEWQASAHTRTHHAGVAAHDHEHRHDGFERHHHAPGGDVVALGAQDTGSGNADDLSAAAGVGSATLPLGLAAALLVPRPFVRMHRWLVAGPVVWRNAIPSRIKRPPRTTGST